MTEPWPSAPQNQPPASPVEAPSTDGSSKRPLGVVIGGAVALLLIAGTGGFFIGRGTAGDDGGGGGNRSSLAETLNPLQVAYEDCTGRDSGDTLSLEDDGATIVVDTRSEYGDSSGMACVLRELDTPGSITAQMDRTTAMMGVQDARSAGIEYSWSYHPDNGVNMVITTAGDAN